MCVYVCHLCVNMCELCVLPLGVSMGLCCVCWVVVCVSVVEDVVLMVFNGVYGVLGT